MTFRRFILAALPFTHAICLGAQSKPASATPDCVFSSFYKSTLSWESGLAWGSGPAAAAGRGDLVGRVIGVRDGEGLAGAHVRVSPTGGIVVTDSAGRFAIRGLSQGRYFVTVFPPPTSSALAVSDSVTVGFDGLRIVAALSAHSGDLVCVGLPRQAPNDSALAAHQRGRLDIVVHPADRPTQPMLDARVLVRIGRDTVMRETDEHGLASFESLEIGEHEVTIYRVGYDATRAVVPIKAGCRTDAEAFLGLSMIGIAPAPARRGRVSVTTC